MLLMLSMVVDSGLPRFSSACLPLLVLERCAQTGSMRVGLFELMGSLEMFWSMLEVVVV